MAVAWAASPVYGRTVALGPTQRAVLDVALRMTRGGRRPELTLGRLSSLTGRPVSSVHEALGRLRALGLLGVSARPGRHGGHRLWRVTPAPVGSSAQLDMGRHRRAVARILRRFAAVVSGMAAADRRPAIEKEGADGGSPTSTDRRPPVAPNGRATIPPPDPFGVTPSDWTPSPPGSSFAERLRRHGLDPAFLAEHEQRKVNRGS